MGDDGVYDLITWLVGAGALVWLVFMAWYTIRAKWWKNPIGRNAFGAGALIWMILTRLWLNRVLPGFQENLFFSLFVYSVAVVVGIQRIYYVEHAQHVWHAPDDEE